MAAAVDLALMRFYRKCTTRPQGLQSWEVLVAWLPLATGSQPTPISPREEPRRQAWSQESGTTSVVPRGDHQS